MVTKMFSTIRQRAWEAGQSLAGDGMLLRLRNASIALVGVVAAVGLGLTLFISQLGFPSVFSGPIPGSPERSGAVHDAIALTHDPGPAPSSARVGHAVVASPNAHSRRQGSRGSGSAGVEGSRQLGVAPGTQSGPAAPHPASAAPVSEPAPQPAQPAPSAPAPTPTSPPSGAGGQSKGTSDVKPASNAAAAVKAASDGSGKSTTSPAGTAGDKNGGRTTSTTGKSPASPSEKAGKDQSVAASTPPTSAVPPAASPETPPATNPAAAKEAADS